MINNELQVQKEKPKSCSDFFNEVFHNIESVDDMYTRNESRFLRCNEKMNWGYNESDIPQGPNPLFLADNQIYLLVPYLNPNDSKNGCQRTFDNLSLLLSPSSFANNRRKGRNIAVSDKRNGQTSNKDKYRPGLRWVKFGIYKDEDVENDVEYRNLIKRKAGLELLTFLTYYVDNLDYFIRFFGQITIDGLNYYSNGKLINNYVACVYKNENGSPEMDMVSTDETSNNCLFLVEDID